MGYFKAWGLEIPKEIADKVSVVTLAGILFVFLNYFASGYLVLLTNSNLHFSVILIEFGGLLGAVIAAAVFSSLIFMLSFICTFILIRGTDNLKIEEIAETTFWLNPILFVLIYGLSCISYFDPKGGVMKFALNWFLEKENFIAMFLFSYAIIILILIIYKKIRPNK